MPLLLVLLAGPDPCTFFSAKQRHLMSHRDKRQTNKKLTIINTGPF